MSEKRKKEAPPPVGFPGDTETRVSNLMQVVKGASLILTALNDHIGNGEVSQIVTTGIGEALEIVADEVELYLFEKPVEAGLPQHELYVLEKRVALLREKIAKKGGQP